MIKHLDGREPIKFFALLFAYSWGVWLTALLLGAADYGTSTYFPLVIYGQFTPLLAAVTLIGRRHGKQAIWQFIRQAFDFNTKAIYFLLALGISLGISAAAHYLAPLFNLQVADTLLPPEAGNPWLVAIPYFFFILFLGGGMEEFGWRGYAQQPLQERFGIVKASILIGLVWGVWHLPLWAFPEGQGGYSAVAFIVQTVFVSIVYGLLYNASGQKLTIALVFHAMYNTAPPFFPFLHQIEGEPQTAYWVYAGVNVVFGLIAAYLIKRRLQEK